MSEPLNPLKKFEDARTHLNYAAKYHAWAKQNLAEAEQCLEQRKNELASAQAAYVTAGNEAIAYISESKTKALA